MSARRRNIQHAGPRPRPRRLWPPIVLIAVLLAALFWELRILVPALVGS